MASVREQILAAFYAKLKELTTLHVSVYRNQDKPQKVDGGIIIMRDGTSEEPEVMLSPLTYIYLHAIAMEVMVQNTDAAQRDTKLDALLVSIGNIINANRNLSGLAEWLEATAPVFIDEPIEGAASLKMAQFTIQVRFHTSNPLN